MDNDNKEIKDNTSVEKVEKKVCADTKKVLSIFNSFLDENKTYTLDEYKRFITLSYKDAIKKKRKAEKAAKKQNRKNKK